MNEDELINNEAPDGTTTPVFAGRALVTELTGPDVEGFDWKITNAEDAQEALEAGEVYAVLTVPSDFSKSILSVSGDNPQRATISIETDDSHSYLSGSVAQVVGEGMASAFGTEITAQYLEGLYGGFGELGDSLQTAADGAGDLSKGVSELSDGLEQLSGGATEAAAGSRLFSTGVGEYSRGVDELSGGLTELSVGVQGLPQLSNGIAKYTSGVSSLSGTLTQLNAVLQVDPGNEQALAGLAGVSAGLRQAASGGGELAAGAAGLPALTEGIAASAQGARKLSAGSGELRSGANDLSAGVGELAAGARESAKGSAQIATGTVKLADGLDEGASQVPTYDESESQELADVAARPVALDVSTDHPVTDAGQGIATFFVPLGLWVGAFAIFLLLRPLGSFALGSSASTGRLAISRLARASAVALAQAVVLVGLLHGVLGVDWMLLPATLFFATLMALAFTAFHFLLTLAFGRAGLVVSLLALAFQIASTGLPLPVEILAVPFRVLSPFLPLSHGIAGMQAIVSGAMGPEFGLAVLALLAFGGGSALLAVVSLGRVRRAASLRASFVG